MREKRMPWAGIKKDGEVRTEDRGRERRNPVNVVSLVLRHTHTKPVCTNIHMLEHMHTHTPTATH